MIYDSGKNQSYQHTLILYFCGFTVMTLCNKMCHFSDCFASVE